MDHANFPLSTSPLRRLTHDGFRSGSEEFPRGITETTGLGIKGTPFAFSISFLEEEIKAVISKTIPNEMSVNGNKCVKNVQFFVLYAFSPLKWTETNKKNH